MRYYVILNGVNSLTKQGLAINEMPPITKPSMRVQREEIDGRDGDIITNLGYSAYDKELEIGLYGESYDINDIIAFFNNSGTVVFSDEPDKYYNYQIINQIDYEKLIKFKTATVVFHCQPFKYPLNEVPLEEEFEYVSGSGTNITLDNTAESTFNTFDLKGNTSQDTTTGKNLLDNNGTSATKNGVTYTINPDKSITLNGTSTQAFIFDIDNGRTLDAGTYILSLEGRIQGCGIYLYVNQTLKTYVSSNNSSDNWKTNFTLDSTTTFNEIRIDVQNSKTFNNVTIYPMIRLASITDDTYEPYTGGIASPNPDYPQNVNVVTGYNEINLVGKNILYFENKTISWGGASINTNGNLITYTPNSSGTAGLSFSSYTQYIKIPQGTTFTFSQEYESGSAWTNGSLTNALRLLKEDGTYTQVHFGDILSNNYNIKKKITYTTTEDYIGFYCYCMMYGIAGATTPLIYHVQLEFNSIATDYEPFIKNSYEINLGKNLFNVWNSGAVNLNTGEFTNTARNRSDYIKVQPNTYYTLWRENTGFATYSIEYDINHNFIEYKTLTNANTTLNFTTSATTYYIVLYQYTNYAPAYKAQLEKGEATPYAPYFTPIEMCKIGDYQDYFFKENNVWYLHKAIGKVDLSTLTWAGGGTYSYNRSVPNIKYTNSNQEIGIGIADNYQLRQGSGMSAATWYGYMAIDTAQITINPSNATKNASGNFYYALATPTDEEITNELLISQLDALEQANSQSGQTNIIQVNSDLPFLLDVVALKLDSDHLIINNIGNTYAKPTLDLEGTGIVDIYLNEIQMFQVDLSEANEIVINTAEMEAYNPTTMELANRQVTGDYSNFKLAVGENDLRFSGNLTKATITNYKRWL